MQLVKGHLCKSMLLKYAALSWSLPGAARGTVKHRNGVHCFEQEGDDFSLRAANLTRRRAQKWGSVLD